MNWYDWTFPELRDLPSVDRRQIESQSAFLAVWDWRTLLAVFVPFGCIWVASLLTPADDDSDEAFWAAGAAATFGIILFLVTFLVRWRHHARYIAAQWKAKQPADAQSSPDDSSASACDGQDPPAMWKRVSYKAGILIGPSSVVVGLVEHWWELVGFGAIVLIVGVGVATTYTACAACHHLQVQFGIRLAHCPRCGAPYHSTLVDRPPQ